MLWVKAFHIIFMVTWFAGLFYLPRLYVYHATADDEPSKKRFVVMERKLFIIMTIGAVATLVFGLWLLIARTWGLYGHMLWLHLKLALVIGLFVYHLYCWRINGFFRNDANPYSHVFYRWFNEIPALMLIAIVLLVVVKPW